MKKDNKFRWSEQFAFGENTPLIVSSGKMEEIVMIIEESIKNIKQTKSPRHIILETWLILDYFVRLFIISGLNIDRYSTYDFDLASKLLPRSFEGCLNFLKKFVGIQNKLPENIGDNKIDFKGRFAYFIIKNHPDFYDKHFIPIVKLYYKKYYPELIKTAKTLEEIQDSLKENLKLPYLAPTAASYVSMPAKKINCGIKEEKYSYRSVSKEWLGIANNLIVNDFFKAAKKFNTTRNKAMHVIRIKETYQKLSINGKDNKEKFKKLKEKSIKLLELLDISIAKTKYKKFK